MGELMDRDREHLRLLTLGYYILAAMTGLFSLLPTAFLLISGSLLSAGSIAPAALGSPQDTRLLGELLFGAAAAVFVSGALGAAGSFLTGRYIRDHRRRTFCIVVAALSCLSVPLGTLVGICTIVVLNRPSVRALFSENLPAEAVASIP